jgi:DNA-binding transcriptional regulator GbsR (MarR family)
MSEKNSNKLEKTFAPEVYVIEDEIITYLINNPLFEGRDQFFLKVFGLFITRQYLTQNTIKKVTGFSIGKVSEEVNNLLEMDLIKISHTSKYGKITYEASSAGLMLLNYAKAILEKLASWESKLVTMKKELDESMKKLQNLYGYNTIYEKTVLYIQIISKYSNLLDQIENAITEIKNKS